MEESPAVTEAFLTWQVARDHYEETKGRVRELKIQLNPDSDTDDLEVVQSKADLPAALKDQAQAMTEERQAKQVYEQVRYREIEKRSGPLQAKFQEAMKRREQVMDEAITVDNDIRAIYVKACQLFPSVAKSCQILRNLSSERDKEVTGTELPFSIETYQAIK